MCGGYPFQSPAALRHLAVTGPGFLSWGWRRLAAGLGIDASGSCTWYMCNAELIKTYSQFWARWGTICYVKHAFSVCTCCFVLSLLPPTFLNHILVYFHILFTFFSHSFPLSSLLSPLSSLFFSLLSPLFSFALLSTSLISCHFIILFTFFLKLKSQSTTSHISCYWLFRSRGRNPRCCCTRCQWRTCK